MTADPDIGTVWLPRLRAFKGRQNIRQLTADLGFKDEQEMFMLLNYLRDTGWLSYQLGGDRESILLGGTF